MRINKPIKNPKTATVWLDHADLAAWGEDWRDRVEGKVNELLGQKFKHVKVYAPNGVLLYETEVYRVR